MQIKFKFMEEEEDYVLNLQLQAGFKLLMFFFSSRVPSLAVFGAVAGGAGLYVTEWRAVLQYVPYYNGKYKTEE